MERVASKKKAFHGVICASAGDIRNVEPKCFDVKHTPFSFDSGHADLISRRRFEMTDEMVPTHEFDDLRELLRLIPLDDPSFPKGGDGC
ncbi:hypothetical protein CA603_32685 [Paraburkholderia hospita]|nr:hypothetical protein CA603_32685 [Paraburkholderia hospita]